MLYASTTLDVFCLTFDSSYKYTRLGRVDDPSGLVRVLSQRAVQISVSSSSLFFN